MRISYTISFASAINITIGSALFIREKTMARVLRDQRLTDAGPPTPPKDFRGLEIVPSYFKS